LKIQIGEDEEYEEVIKEARSIGLEYEHDMDVVGVFISSHLFTLSVLYQLLL
jgi:hypothetical protein